MEDFISKMPEEVMVAIIKKLHLNLAELVELSRTSRWFQKCASATVSKELDIASNFQWILQQDHFFIDLIKDRVETLEIEFKPTEYPNTIQEKQQCDAMARRIISVCTKLKKLRLIHIPDPAYMEYYLNYKFHVPDTVSTLSFIGQSQYIPLEQCSWSYCVENFRNLKNVNFFKPAFECNVKLNMDELYHWFQRTKMYKILHNATNPSKRRNDTESVWLPDGFTYDLRCICETVHTIRIHVAAERPIDPHDASAYPDRQLENLHHLKNLTKIRIDCEKGRRTTRIGVGLLEEFGKHHGYKLLQLHLCCNFFNILLDVLLRFFPNLEVLIIVNYKWSYRYLEQYYKIKPLNEGLPWPERLAQLKCMGFRINKAVLNELSAIRSLVKLDIYGCRFDETNNDDYCYNVCYGYHNTLDFASTNICRSRPVDAPVLKIFFDRKTSLEFDFDYRRDLDYLHEYKYPDGPEVKLLGQPKRIQILTSYMYDDEDLMEGIKVCIEFEGIKEPKYWYCMEERLQPRRFSQELGYY